MEKTISYLARNYDDFKSEFQKYTRKYYPSMMNDFKMHQLENGSLT